MPLAAQGEKRRLSPPADDAHDTACGSEGAKRKKHKKHKKHKKKKGSRSERLKAKAKERSKRRADSDAQGGGAGGADWDDVGREVTLLVLKATEGPFKGIKFKASSPALLLHTRALLLLARPPPPRSPSLSRQPAALQYLCTPRHPGRGPPHARRGAASADARRLV